MDNSGFLTASTLGATISGSYSQTGTGPVNIGGVITGNGISFAGPITMSANLNLNSGNGNIVFSNTVDATSAGAQNLTLTAGTGSITASAAIGGITRIGAFTINSCTNMTVQALTAASVNITETGGTVHLVGDLNTNGSAGIIINANNFIRGGGITASNGSPLIGIFTGTISGGSPSPIIAGSVTLTSSGPLNAGGTVIATSGGVTFNANLNLLGTAIIDSSQSGGNIVFNGTIDGNQNLNLNAGAGNIGFNASLGNTTPLNNISVTGANNLTTSAISSASFSASGIIGQATFGGILNTSGGSGISISANEVTMNSNVTTTGGGPLTIAMTGANPLTVANGTTFSLSGAFTQTGVAPISIGNSIAATGISFAGPITLSGNLSLNSGNGNIAFSNTVDATTAGNQTLTFTAGTGSITASSAIGGATRVGAFTINSCTDMSVQSLTAASVNITETGEQSHSMAISIRMRLLG